MAALRCSAVIVGTASHNAFGHAFGQRYDLPLPFWLYLVGAGAAVLLSFIAMALFLRRTPRLEHYPRLDLLKVPGLGWLTNAWPVSLLRTISLGLFVLIIACGLVGNQNPFKNFAPTFIWVIWWVGAVFIVALIGNLWPIINPWQVFFDWAERYYRRLTGGHGLSLHLHLPASVGVWPAVILLFGFAWMELIWPQSDHPLSLAIVVLIYSGLTWTGMFIFGREPWLHRGEIFSVAFGLLARFSPTEVRVVDKQVCQQCPPDVQHRGHNGCVNCYPGFARTEPHARQLNLRPWAVGLLVQQPVHSSMMLFALLLLSTVTYDGVLETPAWRQVVEWILSSPLLRPSLLSISSAGFDLATVIKSVGLIVVPTLFTLVYMFFCWLVSLAVPNQYGTLTVARLFAFSLIPIALAYHFAHYLSYLLIAGQMIIPLASDPFGVGWNLFGTKAYRLRLDVVDARSVWYTAVTAIVVGHVIAVYLAHVMAIRWFNTPRIALYSQIPMLILMIGYTMVSLWILAQPVVAL